MKSSDYLVGYIRFSGQDSNALARDMEEMGAHARMEDLPLSTIFTDSTAAAPAMSRPGFRVLLDVVRYLQPCGLVVPTYWHLSPWRPEQDKIIQHLKSLRCHVLISRVDRSPAEIKPFKRPSYAQ